MNIFNEITNKFSNSDKIPLLTKGKYDTYIETTTTKVNGTFFEKAILYEISKTNRKSITSEFIELTYDFFVNNNNSFPKRDWYKNHELLKYEDNSRPCNYSIVQGLINAILQNKLNKQTNNNMKKAALKSVILLLVITSLFSCASEDSPTLVDPPIESLPELVTKVAQNISLNSATMGGIIYTDGGSIITKRGVVWDINPNPTINLTSKTVDGNGVGEFTSNLTNLLSGTRYYFRAYATNSVGTAYGNEFDFTTWSLPTLTTNTIVNITKNSATTIANMVSYGNSSSGYIANRGVVWDINPNPTIALTTKTIGLPTNNPDGTLSDTFSCELTNLNQNTTYYARAYITNTEGTAYGEQQIFTTATLGIGDNYQGGIIGYFFRYGDSGYIQGQLHGLIVSPNDQGTARWACNNANWSMINGGTSSAIGSGNANTIFILNNIGCNSNGIAAQICYDLNQNGYSDWYLPSFFELLKIKEKETTSMNFNGQPLWTSTGPGIGSVLGAVLLSGTQGLFVDPLTTRLVRAVRTF